MTTVREPLPKPTRAEREVADLLPIGAGAEAAREVLDRVPFWFHTFSLDGHSLYTPGVARDHRYRIPALPLELDGGEGFHAIAALLGSRVDYLRLDAFDLDVLDERFDLILCFGLLHRVKSPLELLGVLRRRVSPGGSVLLETYGVRERGLENEVGVRTWAAGEVYANDDFVYWGFSGESLSRLARRAGFGGFEVIRAPLIAGHPRIIGTLVGGG